MIIFKVLKIIFKKMVYLYKDFFNLIFQWCDERSKCILGSCCKKAWEALIENRKNCKAGTYTLKPLQNFIREQILYFNIIFQAPMSYGKTATGLCAAFDGWKINLKRENNKNINLCIIIVPSKAIGVWKEEAIKMFGKGIYNKSYKSPLLIPLCTENNDHIKTLMNKKVSKRTFAILLSNTVCHKYKDILQDNFKNLFIIVDEAHTGNEWRRYLNNRNKYLLLSASPVNKKDIESNIGNTKYYVAGEENMKGKIPDLDFKIVNTNEIEMGLHNMNSELNMKTYCMEIYKILKTLKDKNIAIFIPGGRPLENSRRYFAKICEKLDRDYYEFKQESKRKFEEIKKFEESSSSVLIIAHSQSEAININADGAIVIRGDWVNQERINQMIGRVRRTTNKNNCIPIYQIVPKGYPNLKTIYTNACNKLGVHNNNSSIPPDFLFQSFRYLNFLDPGMKKIKPMDIVVLCTQNIGPRINLNPTPTDNVKESSSNKIEDNLLKGWLKSENESAFSPEEKKKILNSLYI